MANCSVVFCTNDWRYKDEYRERTAFSSVSCGLETKERVSTAIDGKFAKLLCHTELTLPSAMTVYKYQKRQYVYS